MSMLNNYLKFLAVVLLAVRFWKHRDIKIIVLITLVIAIVLSALGFTLIGEIKELINSMI